MATRTLLLIVPFYVCLFLLTALALSAKEDFDPYRVLGVRRDSSLDQIKRAYRDLAKQEHPDKNNLKNEDSENKFIQINKAFQILKDPEKRHKYDELGITEENRYTREQRSRDQQFTATNGFRTFTFFSSSDGHLRRKSINMHQFYSEYIEASKYSPHFIFFYSDFCPQCNYIEATWTQITDSLQKFNIGSFSINVHREPKLSLDLGISSVPHIACLIDGQVRPYLERELSQNKVVSFIKTLMPVDLVPILFTEDQQDRFVSSAASQNRLCGLIISNHATLKLRHLLIAFSLRNYYKFAHVSTRVSQYTTLIAQHNIDVKNLKTHSFILTFDENYSSPKSVIKLPNNLDYDVASAKNQLLKWPFIQLPRLTSQKRFDDICSNSFDPKTERASKKLCIILFIQNIPRYDKARRLLREFSTVNKFVQDPIVLFCQVDPTIQYKFVERLLDEIQSKSHDADNITNAILVLERHTQDKRKAHYMWLKHKWDPSSEDELDRAKVSLSEVVESYKSGKLQLREKLVLPPLDDEEAPWLVEKIVLRVRDIFWRIFYYLSSGENPATLLLLFSGPLLLTMYFAPTFSSLVNGNSGDDSLETGSKKFATRQMPSMSEESESSNISDFHQSSNNLTRDGLKLLELKAETYNGMVRLLRPGYRTIVLLCDEKTKEVLLPKFKAAVWPYRRNKTLLFGYLTLGKNIEWFRSLLKRALCYDEGEVLNVNLRNCIGTVLSLNGFKRYFRVYHAKHSELRRADKVGESLRAGENSILITNPRHLFIF